MSRRRDESTADLLSELAANGNVLQVGRARRQAPGGRGGLLVGRVDAPGLEIDKAEQHFAETVLELRHFAIFEQRSDDGMTPGELFQLGGVRGVAGFDFSRFR